MARTACGVGYVSPEGIVYRCFMESGHKGSHEYMPLCWQEQQRSDGEYRCNKVRGHREEHVFTKLKSPTVKGVTTMEDPKTMEDSAQWELIYQDSSKQDTTDRLAVNGGHLYRTRIIAGASTAASGQVAVSMVYVPERQP